MTIIPLDRLADLLSKVYAFINKLNCKRFGHDWKCKYNAKGKRWMQPFCKRCGVMWNDRDKS